MAAPKIRQPIQTKPEPVFSVRHGVTKNRLCYGVATFAEAEEQAERLSSEATHTVEIWNGERIVCWYFDGMKGQRTAMVRDGSGDNFRSRRCPMTTTARFAPPIRSLPSSWKGFRNTAWGDGKRRRGVMN
jgi:hypothetical protein